MQLRVLEDDGAVDRNVCAEVRPKVEYSVSEAGKSLKPMIELMLHRRNEFVSRLP
jgi:DNA-binding HxlR family transcriptional regulator